MELAELQSAIRQAHDKGTRLEITGHASKRAMLAKPQADAALPLSACRGILGYEPEELVLTALAGTARAEVEKALAAKKQIFAFEPPDFSRLLGSKDSGTLGGMIASNLAGPRRLKAGAVRDHALGFTAVSGTGEAFTAGGKVVKNVTGYDLPKLMAGSWGTLAVLHSVTLKVLPAPETEETMVVQGLKAEEAVLAMAAAMGSPAEVSAAAHVPSRQQTFLRLEGITPSLPQRREMLERALASHGRLAVLEAAASRALWREIRDGDVLEAEPDDVIWRCSVAPSDGPRLLASLPGAKAYLDWAGGLVWIITQDAARLHAAVQTLGGHASLVRSDEDYRARHPVRTPESPAVAALSQRVRQAFDPKSILNPGRMGRA